MPKLDRHGAVKLLLLVGAVAACIAAYRFGGRQDLVFALLAPTLFLSFALLHLFDRVLQHEMPANIVLKVVLGENLSSDVLRVLRTEVGDEALFRKRATWKYSFTANESGIIMSQEMSSRLVSRSRESRNHPVPEAGSSREVKLRTYSFGHDEQPVPKVFNYQDGFEQKCVTIDPRIEYSEELLADAQYAKRDISGEHQTRTLIEELHIIFEYPAQFDLELFCHFSCPGREQEAVNLGNGIKRKTHSAKIVLPQQGISFRLFEIPHAQAASES